MAIEWAPINRTGQADTAITRSARSHAMRKVKARQRERLDREYVAANGSPSGQVERKKPVSKKRVQFEMPPGPNDFNQAAEDRMSSPQVMADSLRLCGRYLQWLRPDDGLNDVDFALHTAEQELPEPLLLAASFLVAARHLDAAAGRYLPNKYADRKADVLAGLKERMQNLGDGISADVVNAIVCLLHFELCEGSEEALVHLQGLKTLMTIQNGLYAQEFKGCQMSLEMADLIHTVMFVQNTHIVPMEKRTHGTRPQYSSYHVPILASELKTVGVRKDHCVANLTRIGSTMSMVAKSMEKTLTNCKNVEVQRPSFPGLEATDQLDDHTLFMHAAEATTRILYRYAVQKIAFQDNVNQALVGSVMKAMHRMPNAAWKEMQYFRLFILLTAACASQDQRQKSFCEAYLVRSIMQIGAPAWAGTRTFVVKYIDNADAVLHQ